MVLSIRGCFLVLILALLWATQAQAQRPPKYVRTPYVEVYRDPFGGKHIRTPFTEVHKPGRIPPGFYGPPAYALPEGAVPGDVPMYGDPQSSRPVNAGTPTPATNFGQMDWRTLSRTIHGANQRLNADLARSPSGDFWKKSLKTDEIAQLVPPDAVGPPEEEVREHLQEIAQTMNALSGDPDGSSIVRLASFRNLRGALLEYTLPPDVRTRGQLYSTAAELSRSLDQFATAATWRSYFALTDGGTLAPDPRSGESTQPTPDFATLLGRFDSVNQDPRYTMIAALPAFERTHNLLRAFVADHLAGDSVSPEELPVPLPDEVRRGNLRR